MRARFHAEPIVQATELLLQERMPRGVAVAAPAEQAIAAAQSPARSGRSTSIYSRRIPASRGPIFCRMGAIRRWSPAGSGYSRWHDIAVTRWREDVTCDGWGASSSARHAQRRNLVGRLSTERRRTRHLRGRFRKIVPKSCRETPQSPRPRSHVPPRTMPRFAGFRSPITEPKHGEIEVTSYAEIVLARQPDDVRTRLSPRFSSRRSLCRISARSWRRVVRVRRAIPYGPRISPWLKAKARRRPIRDRSRALSRTWADDSWSAAVADGWPLSNTAGACSIRSSVCAGM